MDRDDLFERPLFFYGSLQDPELFETIVGAAAARGAKIRPASVAGHALRRVAGESFPMLVADPDGADAHGVLVDGLPAEARARIAYFEDSDYALTPIDADLADGGGPVAAAVYAPTAKLTDSGEPWSLSEWPADEKALLIECAREQQSYFGAVPQAIVETWWPDIKARALARLGRKPDGFRSAHGRQDVSEARFDPVYRAFFGVDERFLRHRRFDGAMSNEIQRGLFRSGPGALVIPYDPARDEVVLIEQWRVGAWVESETGPDQNPWSIEVIAGRVENGETPENVARREAVEEAGVELKRLEPIGNFLTSPGICDERLYYFVGEADLKGAGGVHGLLEEDEDIRVIKIRFWDAMEGVARGDVTASPAVLSLLWLARNRDRLRAQWR